MSLFYLHVSSISYKLFVIHACMTSQKSEQFLNQHQGIYVGGKNKLFSNFKRSGGGGEG